MQWTPSNLTAPSTGSAGPGRSLLAHEAMLGQRLYLHAMARFVVVVAIVCGALVARHLVGVTDLDVTALIVLAAAIALYNVCILLLIGRTGEPQVEPNRFRLRRILVHTSIVLDFVALTTALWFVGGVRSPFLAFYLFHIVIASILLSRRDALISTVLAALMLGALATVEIFDLLPARTPTGAIAGDGPIGGRYLATVLVVYLSLFVLVFLSQTHLAEGLRQAERSMQERAGQLEQLSGMRRDFLLVALHDVGSPVGAADSLLRNLRDGMCGPLNDQQTDQIGRILAKLEGLESLVRDLRTLGDLDSADLTPHSTEVSLSFLLSEAIDEQQDAARERGVNLSMEAHEPVAMVYGVPRLIKEAIVNYLTNAIKYTPRGGRITARVRQTSSSCRLEVIDTGVGISSEDQARLFEEFVRVGRSRPEVRQTRGTGLGLSIVRRIAEAHRGSVGVESEPGDGSTFWMELPRCSGSEAPAG